MGLGQWIIIIILVAIIIFGFMAVFNFGKDVFNKAFSESSIMPDIVLQNLEDGIVVGKVNKIVDGDTFVLETGDKIRLSLVNTPERNEGLKYNQAKEKLTEYCNDAIAVIDLDNGQKRSYDRLIGWVDRCDEYTDINAKMLESGFAKVVPLYCKISEFKDRVEGCNNNNNDSEK